MTDPTLREDRKERKERKGSGFMLDFLNKVGLSPASQGGAPAIGLRFGKAGAAAAGLGVKRSIGLSQAGLLGTLMATKAGIVAVLLACTSLAAGIGVMARGTFLTPRQRLTPAAGIWTALPQRPATVAAPAPTSATGASSSLDYMAAAVRKDAWLREQTGAPEAEVLLASAGPAATPPPAHASAPPEVLRDSVGAKALLQKGTGFAGKSTGGSGSSAARSPEGGARNTASAAKVYGLTPMNRSKTSAQGGLRRLVASRGVRTSDALRFANRDGLSQKGAKNPTMSRAGSTFDGAGSSIQGAEGGVPTAGNFGGIQEAPKTKISPNSVLDQHEVPQPAPPEGEKEVTPYKWAMYAAIGGLLAAMLLQKMAGSKKDAAKALQGPAKAAMLASAAAFHWMAAAAAGVAAGMGALMMSTYDQRSQGLMFTISGGLLAVFNIKSALDMSKASQEAEAQKEQALDKMGEQNNQIQQQLSGDPQAADGGAQAQGGGGESGGGDGGMGNMAGMAGMAGGQGTNGANGPDKPKEAPKPARTTPVKPTNTQPAGPPVLLNI